jgi:hypothetical protein
MLQCFRYLPLACERAGAARIIFACQPPLFRLFESSRGDGVEIVAVGGADPWPEADLHLPLLSVPCVTQQWEPLTPSRPYLQANTASHEAWRSRLKSETRLRVGVAWAGSGARQKDRRSIEFNLLEELLCVEKVCFYSLRVAREGEASPVSNSLVDWTSEVTDFADSAALMSELDLIISVDTAVAHLAGGLGLPVWTLLPFVADWRWGLEPETTPWYPTMKLFRQPTLGDWPAVIRTVTEELSRLAAASLAKPKP